MHACTSSGEAEQRGQEGHSGGVPPLPTFTITP